MSDTTLQVFVDNIKKEGYEIVVGVPCSMLGSLFALVAEDSDFTYISATDEGEAVGIAVGAFLAGKKSLVMCQNSGLGNMVNSLSSLVYPYRIPLLLIMSHRGSPQKNDVEHHKLMGEITPKILSLLAITEYQFPQTIFSIQEVMKSLRKDYIEGKVSCLVVTEKLVGYCENPELKKGAIRKQGIIKKTPFIVKTSRYDGLKKIMQLFPEDTAFITTTGFTGREVYAIRDQENNFYMSGSMGHAAAISLGLSICSKKRIVVFDGDGALLMKMGTLATIGHYSPKNLYHFVFNNNCYASTGCQPNVSTTTNFVESAYACGYSSSHLANVKDLTQTVQFILRADGPHFIEIPSLEESPKLLERPSQSLAAHAERFQYFMAK